VPLPTPFQASQEVGVVAVVGVGDHAGVAHAPLLGPVEQLPRDLGLGLEGDRLGDLGLGPAVGIVGPVLGQVEPGGDRPGEGALGGVAVDGLAQGAGVLPGDAEGAAALFGEAGIVKDQDGITLGGQLEQANEREERGGTPRILATTEPGWGRSVRLMKLASRAGRWIGLPTIIQ
jgi:hypothetical protein